MGLGLVGNLPFLKGAGSKAAESNTYWVAHNDCEGNPSLVEYANRSRVDRSTVSRTTYRNAATNVEVALVRIRGGGHTEPSIQQPYAWLFLAIVGRQNQDIEMADEVWAFFQSKTAA